MIQIDGSYLEGGGQILRTSLSLAAITEKPFKIENIRKNRSNPGLAVQHLEAARAIAEICRTEIQAKIGDTTIEFSPNKITDKKELRINIPTAGSTALLISTILPLASRVENQLKIHINGGGTWNKFAPSILYLQKVLLPILEKMNFKAEIKTNQEGFYPKGRADVELILQPWKNPKPLFLEENEVNRIYIESLSSVSLQPRKVAERQFESAISKLSRLNIPIEKTIRNFQGETGSGILIYSLPTLLGSDSLGERGVSAEKVGDHAASVFLHEIEQKAAVDIYASDQLMIYLALAGGKIKTSTISQHAKTNAYIIEKFLPVKFSIDEKDNVIECVKI